MAGVNSREQNYWPGFVDALTNVVLVMVFVVVVFAVSILYYGYELTMAQVKDIVQQKTEHLVEDQQSKLLESEQKIKDLEERLAKALAELKLAQMSAAGKTRESAREVAREATRELPAKGTAADNSPVILSAQAGNVLISYAAGVVELDSKQLKALDALLGSYSGAASWRVELVGEFSEASFTEGQRLSFYRIAALRNYLVSKGVKAAEVKSLIKDPVRNASRSRVTIIVHKG